MKDKIKVKNKKTVLHERHEGQKWGLDQVKCPSSTI
jgi:hypothetical protein